ncbi:hypothetical protein HS088_TW06G00728 [Tripterygium wilfordii]|uniref:Serine-rich protein-related n=1 Tax=Tripterygium wilfordii TaxID=458696 RepID=A0A7J7DJQ5_TRIWF|nr:hypothetical protein HS088_TW06G00728 [Tripterygium wilfordii]
MMESEQVLAKKEMKVEIPSESDTKVTQTYSGLTRQPSVPKTNCLCSPTSHAGSFRCRLHRAPTLQRTKSTGAAAKEASSVADE